jgi:hypothetical protein
MSIIFPIPSFYHSIFFVIGVFLQAPPLKPTPPPEAVHTDRYIFIETCILKAFLISKTIQSFRKRKETKNHLFIKEIVY